MFASISSTTARHMTNVDSRVRKINDADLSVGRAIKSHCKRAWIKKEISLPFFQFTATYCKVMALLSSKTIRYLELTKPRHHSLKNVSLYIFNFLLSHVETN